MKKLFKSFLFVILCFCLILSFAGCSVKKYGGVVSKVEVYQSENSTIEFLQISLNQNNEIEKYMFLGIRIFKNDFETYQCKNLDNLITNEEFLGSDQSARQTFVGSYFGTARLTKVLFDECTYLLIFNGYDLNETKDMEDEEFDAFEEALFNNLDYSSYIGWIKF